MRGMERVHASCVFFASFGVLLRGAPRAGKSDLALRLIQAGAELVADDQVEIAVRDGRLIASPPANLAGLLEVRGIGILRLPALPLAPLNIVVDLVDHADVERIPAAATADILGAKLPLYKLYPFEPSAVAKLYAALSYEREA
jgi:HPr kinase/phosphorylase